jgi:hypothetical protein
MNQPLTHSISRQGLDASFEAEERHKSKLLLEARLLREQQQEEAAARFAQAAQIEERLSEICAARGLYEKSFVHQFSAASCWAQAGNFYHAITLCDELLARPDLPDLLRRHIQQYVVTLRMRRSQLYEELALVS